MRKKLESQMPDNKGKPKSAPSDDMCPDAAGGRSFPKSKTPFHPALVQIIKLLARQAAKEHFEEIREAASQKKQP